MAGTDSLNDDVLIPLLLKGDESAYTQLVSAYHGLMVNLARNIVGGAFADEVAQESWMSVMRALPKFERRSSLKTWILRIVSNTAKSRLRRESRTVNFDSSLDEALPMISSSHFDENGHWRSPPNIWSADTPDAILASEQLRTVIDQAIMDLPPLQRAAICLREMQNMDMDSICKVLDISESNGRVLIHRARSHIRDAIDKHQEK